MEEREQTPLQHGDNDNACGWFINIKGEMYGMDTEDRVLPGGQAIASQLYQTGINRTHKRTPSY